MASQRQLNLGGLHNIRDLGGLPLRMGGQTQAGRIYRGCAMGGLDPNGLAAVAGLGIHTALDLRSDSERATSPTPLSRARDVHNVHVPIFSDLAPIYKLGDLSKNFSLSYRYGQALDKSARRFAAAIQAIAEAPAGAVYFHCTLGKDRTGLLAALLLDLAGVPAEEIIADYALTASEASPYLTLVREHSFSGNHPPEFLDRLFSAPAEVMAETLDRLYAQHGGAASYLARAGLSEGLMQRAVERLVAA